MNYLKIEKIDVKKDEGNVWNEMPLKIALLSFPSPFLHFSFGDLQKEIRQTQKEERERGPSIYDVFKIF